MLTVLDRQVKLKTAASFAVHILLRLPYASSSTWLHISLCLPLNPIAPASPAVATLDALLSAALVVRL